MTDNITAFLTSEEIKEFQKITLRKKGISLTLEQAADQGEKLIRLFELIYPLKSGRQTVNNGTI